MNFVVDASVAIKWFVQEIHTPEAARLRPFHHDCHAPELLIVEVTNAAWKKVARGEIEYAQAERIARHLPNYIHTIHRSMALNERALGIAMALDYPAYDCLYLACAEAIGGAVITADQRLLAAVQGTAFQSYAHHIAALPGEFLQV